MDHLTSLMRELHSNSKEQQVQIDALQRFQEVVRDEGDALRACLESVGLVGREQYLAQVHRRRFARAMQRHPCRLDMKGFEALQNLELFRSVMRCAGQHAAHQCAVVSRTLRRGLVILPPRLYAVGGSDGTRVLDTAEWFNERLCRWEAVPPMPTPRSNLVALAHEGQLYAIGGTDGAQVLSTVELFDEDGSQWRTLPPMPTPRSGMAAAACSDHLYVIGGREGFQSLDVVERFSAGQKCWESLSPMYYRRRFLAAATLDGKLYAIGGEDDRFMALRTVECYDEALNSWACLTPMPTRRRGLAAVSLRGRIYAIGGGHVALGGGLLSIMGGLGSQSSSASTSPRGQVLGTVERYDVAADVWETMPPLSTARMFLAAVVLGGRLYAIGGSDGVHALRTVERFDEDRNCWETLQPMPTRRVFFSAAVLQG